MKKKKHNNYIKLEPDDVNGNILLLCAMRYAIGRQSYAVGTICEWLIKSAPYFSNARRDWYISEIQNEIAKQNFMNKYDKDNWLQVIAVMKRLNVNE